MSTSIVLLASNEEKNLRYLLPQIRKYADGMKLDYEILIIDSMKPTDHTKEIAQKYHTRYIRQEEPGYGGAFRTGIRYATKECFLVLDADGSHNPKDIPAIHRKYAQGFDLVIGSRYVKGGRSNDRISSFLMSKLLNFVMRIVIGVRAKDISTSYRLYDTKQVKSVDLVCKNFDIQQEVILKMKMNKRNQNQEFKIGEVPIVFRKRWKIKAAVVYIYCWLYQNGFYAVENEYEVCHMIENKKGRD